ncbi:MAG: hypothetical protein ACI82A_003886 [Candidatus Azotimanducaceae bacterium]|jgi:hypothetical protein
MGPETAQYLRDASEYGAFAGSFLGISGLAILMLCLVIGWIDRHLIHYWGALVALGIGWILLTYGWDWLLALSAPFLIALLMALAWSRFTTRAAQFA